MARGDKTIYMEVMIISSSSVDGLNTKINTNLQNGWKPLGSHQVVRSHSQNRFRGDQLADTIHQSVYSITMIKEEVVLPKGGPIDLSKLKGHVPDTVISQIPEVMEKFQINTPLRLAHFLAQCGHESGNFKATQENLNYSADGLKKIFPKYFPGNLSESYARNPEKIASKVYGGRMGNGDESTKEGYKFRGRGYIQLTGKANYAAFAKAINEDTVSNPDLVSTKYPLASAAWFFSKNGLNAIADKGADDATVTAVTKRVNGGTIGLADRIKHFKEYYHLLA